MPGIWQSSASFGAAFIAMQAYGVGPVWAHTTFLNQIVENRHEILQIWCKCKHCQKAQTIFVLPAFSTEEVNVGSSSTCDCCLGPGRPVLDPWQPNQVWKPGVKTCSSMKFDPFSFQRTDVLIALRLWCTNMEQTSVTSGRRAYDWKLPKRKPSDLGRFLERGWKKRCGNVNVDHFSEVFYAVRGASSFFTACLGRLTVISRIGFASKGFRFLRHVLFDPRVETYKRSQQNLSRALSSEQLQIVATPITDFIMTGRRTARCVCNAGRWAQWGLISLFALAIRLKACGILESIHLEPSGEPGHL